MVILFNHREHKAVTKITKSLLVSFANSSSPLWFFFLTLIHINRTSDNMIRNSLSAKESYSGNILVFIMNLPELNT